MSYFVENRSGHSCQSHLFDKILVHLIASLVQSKFILALFLNLEHLQSKLLDLWSHVVELNGRVQLPEIFLTHHKKLSIRLPLIPSDELLLVDVALVRVLLALVTAELLRLFEELAADLALEAEVLVGF